MCVWHPSLQRHEFPSIHSGDHGPKKKLSVTRTLTYSNKVVSNRTSHFAILVPTAGWSPLNETFQNTHNQSSWYRLLKKLISRTIESYYPMQPYPKQEGRFEVIGNKCTRKQRASSQGPHCLWSLQWAQQWPPMSHHNTDTRCEQNDNDAARETWSRLASLLICTEAHSVYTEQ
jgi:hypothetical protein